MVVKKVFLILFLDKHIYDDIELPKCYIPCFGDTQTSSYDLVVGSEDLDIPKYFKSDNINEILDKLKNIK